MGAPSHRLRRTGLLLASLFALIAVFGAGTALASYSIGEFGLPAGATAGHFGSANSPSGIAIEQSSGDVYVSDTNNARVQKFGPANEFLLMFGKEVTSNPASTHKNVCTAAEESFCKTAKTAGVLGETSFSLNTSGKGPNGIAIEAASGDVFAMDQNKDERVEEVESDGTYLREIPKSNGAPNEFLFEGHTEGGIAVDPVEDAVHGGYDVFVANTGHNEIDEYYLEAGAYHYLANITGTGAESFSAPTGLAFDSAGDLYVVDKGHHAVDEFSAGANGTVGAFAKSFGATALTEPWAVAVDSSGDVLVLDAKTKVDKFTQAAPSTVAEEIGAGTITSAIGVAVNASGVVYVPDFGAHKVLIFTPSAGEAPAAATEACTAQTATGMTLNGSVNPHELATEYFFKYGLSAPAYGSTTTKASAGSGDSSVAVTPTAVGSLQPHQTYHFQLVAENEIGPAAGGDLTCLTLSEKPAVDGQSTASITQTSATLQAQINPNNEATAYQFEYVEAAHYSTGDYSAGAKVPVAPGSVGSGFGDQAASAPTGAVLAANTTYDYRVVATNGAGTTDGANQTFTTKANPPLVTTTAGAAHIAQASAEVAGAVTPEGAALSTCTFEYLTEAAYIAAGNGYSGSGKNAPAKASCVPAAGSVPTAGTTTVTAALGSLAANTTYHFRLVAANSGGSTLGADKTFTTLAQPPLVFTGLPSGLGTAAATVHGSITPQGVTATYAVEYVSEAGYEEGAPDPYEAGSTTPVEGLGAATSAESVTVALSGLQPATTYHYRLAATNDGGSGYGEDRTFTTYGIAPSVETGAASAVTSTAATLAGIINPEGAATSYRFQYGTTAAYGATSPEVEAGAGIAAEGVSADLTDLAPATTYHYRLVAVNAAGVSYGADQTFTTVAALPTPPPVPPTPKPTPAKCKKGFVKSHGKCMRKPVKHHQKKAHKKRHNRHPHNDRRADR